MTGVCRPSLTRSVPLPTLAWVRLALAPALVLIVTGMDRGYQTDFWQHLARGRLIAETGTVVSADRFTFTVAGRPMQDNNWLTQLLYHRLYTLGGVDAVQLVNSLVLAAAVAVVVWIAWRAGRSTGAAAAVGVFTFLGLWQTFLIRPQSFSLLLFAVLYALLLESGRRRWLLALAPPLLALWANVHGGFAVGLLLIAGFAVAAVIGWLGALRTRGTSLPHPHPAPQFLHLADGLARGVRTGLRHGTEMCPEPDTDPPRPPAIDPPRAAPVVLALCLALCLALSAAATLANPYGWRVYQYATELSHFGLERGIEEWLPPTPGLWIGKVFLLSLALLAGLFAATRRRPTVREVALIALFLPPACTAVRMVAWWVLVIAPILARLVVDVRHTRFARREPCPPDVAKNGNRADISPRAPGDSVVTAPRRPSLTAACAMAVITAAVVLSVPQLQRFNPIVGTLRPAGRVEDGLGRISRQITADSRPRRIFCRLEWGNYFAWAAGPRCGVFMEGHVELYPDPLWRRYQTISAGGEGWDRLLDGYAVDTLVLDASYHTELLRRVRTSGRWRESGRAGDAVWLVRSQGTPEAPAAAGTSAVSAAE